jgi:erythromycin esterase-like protein
MANHEELIAALAKAARPFSGARQDFDPLLDMTRGATCVLIGEASHGTHDFYQLRAELTKRLIVEQGFNAIAAEADFPDAYRVNRYVRGLGGDADAEEALADFRRFPAWMWRNADVLDFVGWLRAHNDAQAPAWRVGFYGLDLYSLHGSIAAVLGYLADIDPAAAERARERYACFDHFGEELERYGYWTRLGLSADCEGEVVAQLTELQARRADMLRHDGLSAEDELFQAEQNARVVKDAEEYYRSMFAGRVSTWNLRDRHMADTLDALLRHLSRSVDRPKVVVWAHNSHVGDARATEVGAEGELSLGQLARERYRDKTVLIGLSTYTGNVIAASDWGGPAERKQVQPALPGSYEDACHQLGRPSFLLFPKELYEHASPAVVDEPRLQRAIGVVYRPRTERASHYYHVELARQLDALIHVDQSRALEPLERKAPLRRDEVPETFPTGV